MILPDRTKQVKCGEKAIAKEGYYIVGNQSDLWTFYKQV